MQKSRAAVATRQLTEDHLDSEYDWWTRVYTHGSIDPSGGGGTAKAAAFLQAEVVGTSERLVHQASPTTAELEALRLALWRIRTCRARGPLWVLAVSRVALALLDGLERFTPLAQYIARYAIELREKGQEIAFQWIPSHCGIRRNEVADFLVMRAHKDPGCPLSAVPRFFDAKLLIKRAIIRHHPDPEVVVGVSQPVALEASTAKLPQY